MTAQVASDADDRIRVWCPDPDCDRPLDTSVATVTHGQNLAAKHDREHHAEAAADPAPPSTGGTLDVSAAARVVVNAHNHAEKWPGIRSSQAYGVAMGLWCALLGTDDQDGALIVARSLAVRPTTAHLPPF